MQIQLSKTVASLADHKNKAKNDIDDTAGIVRARYITVVSGQSETYALKADECRAYKLAGYPADLTDYLWVAAEADAQALSPQDAADLVLATRLAWIAVGSVIEKERIKGKRLVDNAADIATVLSLRSTYISILNGL